MGLGLVSTGPDSPGHLAVKSERAQVHAGMMIEGGKDVPAIAGWRGRGVGVFLVNLGVEAAAVHLALPLLLAAGAIESDYRLGLGRFVGSREHHEIADDYRGTVPAAWHLGAPNNVRVRAPSSGWSGAIGAAVAVGTTPTQPICGVRKTGYKQAEYEKGFYDKLRVV